MPTSEPKHLPRTFSVDVLDDYGTKLLTAYGVSTRVAKNRAARAELSLIGYVPSAIAPCLQRSLSPSCPY